MSFVIADLFLSLSRRGLGGQTGAIGMSATGGGPERDRLCNPHISIRRGRDFL